jgi:hypothetical protein
MDDAASSTWQKALALNLDVTTYGTFAEIGGGQEVARWFFSVGGAAGTVAKTISAYDVTVSDALYGSAQRYVSRQRLEAMLEQEFVQLPGHLDPARGDATSFFAFADTVAARGYRNPGNGRGWIGVHTFRTCTAKFHVTAPTEGSYIVSRRRSFEVGLKKACADTAFPPVTDGARPQTRMRE